MTQTQEIPEALTVARIELALETLLAAFAAAQEGFPGAVQCDDPTGVFSEARRNLTALVAYLHGEEAWRQVQE